MLASLHRPPRFLTLLLYPPLFYSTTMKAAFLISAVALTVGAFVRVRKLTRHKCMTTDLHRS